MSDRERWKRFAVGFVLIVACSAVMHVNLMKKGALKTERYEPRYTDTVEGEEFIAQGPPIEGTVSAISFDRFFVKSGEENITFKVEEGFSMPAVGQRVRVKYFQGTPPTALQLERLD